MIRKLITYLLLVFFMFGLWVLYAKHQKVKMIKDTQTKLEEVLNKDKMTFDRVKGDNNSTFYNISLEEGTSPEIILKNLSEKLDFDKKHFVVKRAVDKVNVEFKKKVVFSINFSFFKVDRLAILIDDVGENIDLVYEFMAIKEPLNFAVIPFLPYSRKSSEVLKQAKYEVILHMPMESLNKEELNLKTRGIVTVDMPKWEIQKNFLEGLNEVGDVKGVNNHMGSKFTQNEEKMSDLFNVMKGRKLYYVDSVTTPNSMGYSLAKEMGVNSIKNDMFLDNDKNVESIKEVIRKAVALTKERHKLLVIGHCHSATKQALIEMLPYIKDQNVKLSYISELM